MQTPPRCRAAPALLLLALAAFLVLGCKPAPPRPNLLLIVSDALRADALSCYGGAAQTPNLCALAARGAIFEHAFANAPWTLPSAVAIFTGNSPSQYWRVAGPDLERDTFYYVPTEERLLAEALAEEGYAVEAAIENPVVKGANVLQGFTKRSYGQKRNRAILDGLDPALGFDAREGRNWLVLWAIDFILRPAGEPFYLLHWIDDPHAVYRPPAAALEAAVARGELDVAALPRALDFYTGLGHHNSPKRGLHKLRNHTDDLSPAELAVVKELYHLEVESVDERVGYLMKALAQSGREEHTVVAFTADHGEGFGEHGGFLHGNSLYDELVRVPLILAGPGVAAGVRVETPVSLVDLAPTLGDLLGVEDLGPVQGQSLRRLMQDETRPSKPRYQYLTSPSRLDHDALVDGRYKLIADVDGGAAELYDLLADPGEQRNLAADLPDVVAAMRAALEVVRAQNQQLRDERIALLDAAASEQVRKETEEKLRAVGYLD